MERKVYTCDNCGKEASKEGIEKTQHWLKIESFTISPEDEYSSPLLSDGYLLKGDYCSSQCLMERAVKTNIIENINFHQLEK